MDSDLCNLELELRRLNRKVVSSVEDWLIGVKEETLSTLINPNLEFFSIIIFFLENEHGKERSGLELKGTEPNELRDSMV